MILRTSADFKLNFEPKLSGLVVRASLLCESKEGFSTSADIHTHTCARTCGPTKNEINNVSLRCVADGESCFLCESEKGFFKNTDTHTHLGTYYAQKKNWVFHFFLWMEGRVLGTRYTRSYMCTLIQTKQKATILVFFFCLSEERDTRVHVHIYVHSVWDTHRIRNEIDSIHTHTYTYMYTCRTMKR